MALSDQYSELYLDQIYGTVIPEARKVIDRFAPMIQTNLYPPVRTKRDMVQRYQQGEFGNASPTWDNYEDWYWDQTSVDGMFHIRNRVTGGPTWYNIPSTQMEAIWKDIIYACRIDPSTLYISAMAPKHLLNGELMRTHEGLYLFYSTVQKPMRDSLKEGGREAKGLTAKFILQHYMNQRSYAWTMMLLDRYKDHVIEFTVVDRCWGTEIGHNALFWEVRKY